MSETREQENVMALEFEALPVVFALIHHGAESLRRLARIDRDAPQEDEIAAAVERLHSALADRLESDKEATA